MGVSECREEVFLWKGGWYVRRRFWCFYVEGLFVVEDVRLILVRWVVWLVGGVVWGV